METKTLYSGIDTLAIGFNVSEFQVTERDLEMLGCEKMLAGDKIFKKDGSPILFKGLSFHIMPKGASGYEWVLKNGDIEVCIARQARGGRYYPEVYITFRAHFLAREGHIGAFGKILTWLQEWCLISGNLVSRVDLCIDKQIEKMPEINISTEMFTRSSKSLHETAHSRGLAITGYTVGKEDLMCRIYDKTIEVLQSQKEWFFPVWEKNGWDGAHPVCRTEFQGRRNFLKQMSVTDFDSLCERAADMWRYYTHDWLTVRHENPDDKNRGRWQIQEWWLDLQQGIQLFGVPYGVLRLKTRQAKYDHLMKQGRGCLVAAAAQGAALFGVEPSIKELEKTIVQTMNTEDFTKDVTDKSYLVSSLN